MRILPLFQFMTPSETKITPLLDYGWLFVAPYTYSLSLEDILVLFYMYMILVFFLSFFISLLLPIDDLDACIYSVFHTNEVNRFPKS
jgi:hypothetical protein